MARGEGQGQTVSDEEFAEFPERIERYFDRIRDRMDRESIRTDS
jgi:hypothetical protein